jgi:hypothetical protein
VHPLVEVAALCRDSGVVRRGLALRVLLNEQAVLMVGMVLEVGVETVAPCWLDGVVPIAEGDQGGSRM